MAIYLAYEHLRDHNYTISLPLPYNFSKQHIKIFLQSKIFSTNRTDKQHPTDQLFFPNISNPNHCNETPQKTIKSMSLHLLPIIST